MTDQNLDKIRQFLHTKLGLEYGKKREKELYIKLGSAAKDFNFRDTNKFLEWLLKQPMNDSQTKLLASSLTIGETYFFREINALDYLRQVFLPELVKQRKTKSKKIRIWSAGCATGEEAYSIAIILQQVIPDFKNWDITILATDINPTFLNKARKGVYSNWSFRETPASYKSNYFKKLDKNNYQIIDSVKEMVTFSHLNLAKDDYPSVVNNTADYDVIFCRNVLIYFSIEGIKEVAKKLYRTLNIDGMLAVSPVEAPNLISNSSFTTVSFNGNTFFRKDVAGKLKAKKVIKKDNQTTNFDSKIRRNKPDKNTLYKKVDSSSLKTEASKQVKGFQKTTKIAEENNNFAEYDTALNYYTKGSLEKAEQLLKSIKSRDKNITIKALLLLAKVYADTNRFDESEKYCKKVLSIDKINVEAYYLLATLYGEQGRSEETIKSLNNVLFLNPDYVLAHFLLGNTYIKRGNMKFGIKHFENAKKCLSKLKEDEIIDESEGLTAGRLSVIMDSMVHASHKVEIAE